MEWRHVLCIGLLVLLGLSIEAQKFHLGLCPSRPPEEDFIVPCFMGTWYEVFRSEGHLDFTHRCGRLIMTQEETEDPILVRYTYTKLFGSEITVTATIVQVDPGVDDGVFAGIYHTDSAKMIWIFARTRPPTDGEMEDILDAITDQNIDRDKLVRTDGGCPPGDVDIPLCT